MRKYLISISIIFLLSVSSSLSSIFWEVKSPTATVYILGSIHMANESFYPLDTAIENAFSRSDYLVTEIAMDNIDQAEVNESVYYPKGDSLPLHIADTTYDKVLKYFGEKGFTRKMIRRFKPSALVMTMQTLEYMKSGLLPQYGIDMYFTNKAGTKSILQLETPKSQFDILAKMDENPDEFLNSSMEQMPTMTAIIDTMITAWKNGDVETFARLVDEDMKLSDSENAKEFGEALLDNRNDKMFEKIKEYLDSKSTYFVIVGAAHLAGEASIINLLEKATFNPVRK